RRPLHAARGRPASASGARREAQCVCSDRRRRPGPARLRPHPHPRRARLPLPVPRPHRRLSRSTHPLLRRPAHDRLLRGAQPRRQLQQDHGPEPRRTGTESGGLRLQLLGRLPDRPLPRPRLHRDREHRHESLASRIRRPSSGRRAGAGPMEHPLERRTRKDQTARVPRRGRGARAHPPPLLPLLGTQKLQLSQSRDRRLLSAPVLASLRLHLFPKHTVFIHPLPLRAGLSCSL
ncbi:hypothetical protein PTTG_30760, partial [Puccinia triticina 1-1 BBBD Race 1]